MCIGLFGRVEMNESNTWSWRDLAEWSLKGFYLHSWLRAWMNVVYESLNGRGGEEKTSEASKSF